MGRCYNSTVVDAPVADVWAVLRDFHDLSWARGVVTKVEIIGRCAGDEVGARRVLNGAFHETLLSLDEPGRTLSYSIDDGPGPVSKDVVKNYVGRVSAKSVTASDRTFVDFESPDEQSVSDFCNPIYHALLQALRAHFA